MGKYKCDELEQEIFDDISNLAHKLKNKDSKLIDVAISILKWESIKNKK